MIVVRSLCLLMSGTAAARRLAPKAQLFAGQPAALSPLPFRQKVCEECGGLAGVMAQNRELILKHIKEWERRLVCRH